MKRKNGMILMEAGTVLMILALSLFLYNKWEANRAQDAAEDTVVILEEMTEDDISDNGADMTTAEIDGYEYIGTLTIDRFGLELPVMAEWSYAGLKIAPGRYTGSAETNDLVICGHNYERHFGQLKHLEAGDRIVFTDVEENEFIYEVAEVRILEPTAVKEMVGDGEADWDLTLFTCTLGGQARVTVRCALVDE